MLLIPKIYLKNGKAIAIDGTTSPIFSENPQTFMEALQRLGYAHFHVVDLSAQNVGLSQHLPLLQSWLQQKLTLTVSGNIITLPALESYLNLGVSLVALQTVAYQQPQFVQEACQAFPERIATHIDVKAKKVMIPGWTAVANKTALDYVERFHDAGVKTIFYSDLDQQNTLTFCRDSLMRVFISSELNSVAEIIALEKLAAPRLEGLILNKALYQGKVDLSSVLTQVADMTQELGTEQTLMDED